jgi:hypothetical protein
MGKRIAQREAIFKSPYIESISDVLLKIRLSQIDFRYGGFPYLQPPTPKRLQSQSGDDFQTYEAFYDKKRRVVKTVCVPDRRNRRTSHT